MVEARLSRGRELGRDKGVFCYALGGNWNLYLLFRGFLFFETGSYVVQAESDLELMILPDPAPKY